MTDKDIQRLTDRYLAGATTPAEERRLALALRQRGELSEEWQAVSLMLGELTAGGESQPTSHCRSASAPAPKKNQLQDGRRQEPVVVLYIQGPWP